MVTIKKIGERVKNVREQRNYSQQYVASKLGVSQKAYSKIETGETKLSVDNLLKLTEILDTSVNELLDSVGNAVYNNLGTHNGEGIVLHKTTSDKINDLYEKIIKVKDEEIERLKQQNDSFLKTIEKLTGK
jgi:transcriptional regulator with XRE-family HTH domain